MNDVHVLIIYCATSCAVCHFPLSMTKESVALARPPHTRSRHVVVCNWNPIKFFERKAASSGMGFHYVRFEQQTNKRAREWASERQRKGHKKLRNFRHGRERSTHNTQSKELIMRLHQKARQKEEKVLFLARHTKVVITSPFSGLFTSILLTYLYPFYHLILCGAFKLLRKGSGRTRERRQ